MYRVKDWSLPDTYISAGVPSSVMALMKEATSESVIGSVPIDRLAIRSSSCELSFCKGFVQIL